jgi:hypothetical protein
MTMLKFLGFTAGSLSAMLMALGLTAATPKPGQGAAPVVVVVVCGSALLAEGCGGGANANANCGAVNPQSCRADPASGACALNIAGTQCSTPGENGANFACTCIGQFNNCACSVGG